MNTLLTGATKGVKGVVTDSSWLHSQSVQYFRAKHFLTYIKRGNKDQKVFLIFDGRKTHVNIPVIEWTEKHNTESFVLPAHSSNPSAF